MGFTPGFPPSVHILLYRTVQRQHTGTIVFVYAQCKPKLVHNKFVTNVSFFQICVKIVNSPFLLQLPDLLIVPSLEKKQRSI